MKNDVPQRRESTWRRVWTTSNYSEFLMLPGFAAIVPTVMDFDTLRCEVSILVLKLFERLIFDRLSKQWRLDVSLLCAQLPGPTGWSKKLRQLHNFTTDRLLFFAATLSRKFATKWSLTIPPDFKLVSTLSCEILAWKTRVTISQGSVATPLKCDGLWSLYCNFINEYVRERSLKMDQSVLDAVKKQSPVAYFWTTVYL